MFVSYDYLLQAPLPTLRGSSYRLYAALCDLAGPAMASTWHDSEQTPLHQYLYHESDGLHWRVHTLDAATDAALAAPLHELRALPLAGNVIPLAAPDVVHCDAAAFLKHHLSTQAPPERLQLRWLSPTAFRVGGHYDTLPVPARLLKSAAIRLNSCLSEALRVQVDDLAEVWPESCLLSRFRLQSASFSLKDVYIPGFMGDATVALRGSTALRALNAMLFAALAVVGCGVKTALGMGAVAVQADSWTLWPPCDTIGSPREGTTRSTFTAR